MLAAPVGFIGMEYVPKIIVPLANLGVILTLKLLLISYQVLTGFADVYIVGWFTTVCIVPFLLFR